jgi:hypothetical protein
MNTNLNSFIAEERRKREPEQVNENTGNQKNIKMSLLDLKNAIDMGVPVNNNPIVENIKKVENAVDKKIYNKPDNNQIINNGYVENKQPNYNEKEDEFTKQLLMKTREYVTGGKHTIQENFQEPIEPKFVNSKVFNSPNNLNKEAVIDTLKDTILDLYVKERVEGIIKEYLLSDEGNKLIKSIVVGLFKKK